MDSLACQFCWCISPFTKIMSREKYSLENIIDFLHRIINRGQLSVGLISRRSLFINSSSECFLACLHILLLLL